MALSLEYDFDDLEDVLHVEEGTIGYVTLIVECSS
jgi:hypothetical protein